MELAALRILAELHVRELEHVRRAHPEVDLDACVSRAKEIRDGIEKAVDAETSLASPT